MANTVKHKKLCNRLEYSIKGSCPAPEINIYKQIDVLIITVSIMGSVSIT